MIVGHYCFSTGIIPALPGLTGMVCNEWPKAANRSSAQLSYLEKPVQEFSLLHTLYCSHTSTTSFHCIADTRFL